MIKHIKCDIFESGADFICHQVNCQGAMNSGVAKQVREKYPKVYNEYKRWCDCMPRTELLGIMQFVNTKKTYSTTFKGVVNLFAQSHYGYDGKCYTNYDALRSALTQFKSHLIKPVTIAIPFKLGCCRGGGQWDIVYDIIKSIFENTEHEVLICEYDKG